MINKNSEITPFDLGMKDMGPGLNNDAFTHPGVTGIGPSVLYSKVLDSYNYIRDSLNKRILIPIFKNREGYIISYTRELVNSTLEAKQVKEQIFWILEICRLSDKTRKILLLILAEYLEIKKDSDYGQLYKKARNIRKEDPNRIGTLLLQLKTKTGFPFNINSNYLIENSEWVLTEWGVDHFNEVAKMLPLIKKDLSKREYSFLELIWKPYFRKFRWGWSALNRKELFTYCQPYSIRHKIYADVIQEAENLARIKTGIPKIGQEKWKQEARLFEKLKDMFPDYIVKHHYRSQWLGRQHIDIFIEDINVGIEFHGEQHFKPINYFGGEEAYKYSKRRDDEKLKKCNNEGVKLIIVRENYDFLDLLNNIKEYVIK